MHGKPVDVVSSVVVRTPFGRGLYVARDARGITASRWTAASPRSLEPRRAHPKGPADALLDEAVRQLRAYFGGRLRWFDVPVSTVGTPFEMAVWSAVRRLEFGTLVSYADVARAVGRPNAYRGVARAMGRTPLALFIPAHRVVGSDGRIKGACSASMRRRLVAFERARY